MYKQCALGLCILACVLDFLAAFCCLPLVVSPLSDKICKESVKLNQTGRKSCTCLRLHVSGGH